MEQPSHSEKSVSVLEVQRQELFEYFLMSEAKSIKEKLESVKYKIIEKYNIDEDAVNKEFSSFVSQFKKRWEIAHRMSGRFIEKNIGWLKEHIKFNVLSKGKSRSTGRPCIPFSDCSERTKRIKTEALRSLPVDELSYATQMSLRLSGQVDSSKLLKEITSTTPTRSRKYLKSLNQCPQEQFETMSGDEALSMFIDAKFTVRQYKIIRNKQKSRFPAYQIIQAAKKRCYPNNESMFFSESLAEVRLQAILDHTANRLLTVFLEVLKSLSFSESNNLFLYSKWGFDGSSGNPEYKQVAHTEGFSDQSVFLTSFVPLQLICPKENGENKIIWQNPRPSSTRYCRPVKFQFCKETHDFVLSEKEKMDEQIKVLQPTLFNMDDIRSLVTHKLFLTMIDGKICNYVTETNSTQRCVLCNLTSKDFNNLEAIDKAPINTSNVEFGISILHGWIRFFESLLHLCYKLPIKQWQARGEENKKIVSARKSEVQKKFFEGMGLLVDRPKPGFGSSNDGNTARRFFNNPNTAATITGIGINIILRYGTIMKIISSGYEIILEKFKTYTRETLEMYVDLYPWYPMPTSVHKILCHGSEVIAHYAILPIGQLSEEALEARNKEFKMYRRNYSRKCSRTKTNEDVFHSLLMSSDPVVSAIRPLPTKYSKSLPPEVLSMLKAPSIPPVSSDESATCTSDSSEEDSD